jgi:type I restriction enzyme S subunit
MKAQDLKNSILQLAIQGKLVEQREEEGTARELIEQIQAEKEQLIKEKKIKKEKPLPEITEDEKPFDIPESWEWVKLGTICNIINGFTPSKSNSKFWSNGTIPWFTIADVRNQGRFINYTEQSITEQAISKNSERIIPKDSILLCCTASVGEYAYTNIDLTTNQQFNGLVVRNEYEKIVYPLFLYQFSKTLKRTLLIQAGKTTINFVSVKKVSEIVVPLPPLAEQKRIVAKIEELLPYIDQYDKAYTEVEELNKKFPEDMQKSILQYAIQGKLVEQREEEGTAEELYQIIQAEKEKLIKEGKIKKTKPLPEITEEEIPFDIPENWKWVRLADIFDINPRNNVSDEISVSFIPMALIEDGYVSQFTYEVKAWGDVKKGYTHFQDGDIVMAKITPCFQNLKSALMINLENGVGAGTTELHVLRSHSNICREFFMWFIKSPNFVSTCVKNMTGTAGQKRVPTDVLKNYAVPLPPLTEQKRIVEKIEELMPYTKQMVKKLD